MNAKLTAKLTMYRTTEQIQDTNASIIAAVPALVTVVAAFKAIIVSILEMTELTDLNLSGIAAAKSDSKQHLARITSDYADIISAFASATKNAALKEEVNYSYHKLSKMRDESLVPVCRIVHARAEENLDALRDYGITPQKLTLLDNAINDYAAKSPKTHAAIANRQAHNANLRELFKQADDILKNQMDGLMKNFRTSHPDFYNAYLAAREIIDPHTTVTQLKGSVFDTEDKPLKGAIVTIIELNKSAKTNTKGEYLFKPVEHGKFTVTITKDGYQIYQKEEVELKIGKIAHLHTNLPSII